MIAYFDRCAWIAALAVFTLAVAAQELKRPERAPLAISRQQVLTATRQTAVITTNQVVVGKRLQLQVRTNQSVNIREFPMMTDALQRSQAYQKDRSHPLTDEKRSLDDADKR